MLQKILQRHQIQQLDLMCSYWDVYRYRLAPPQFSFNKINIIRADGWTELSVLLLRSYIAQNKNVSPTLHFSVQYLLLPHAITPQQRAMQALLRPPIADRFGVTVQNVLYKHTRGPRDVCIKFNLFLKHLVLYTCSDLAPLYGFDHVSQLCDTFIRSVFHIDSWDFVLPITEEPAVGLVPTNPYVCANCGESTDFCRWQSEWSTASLGAPSDEASIDVS
eukprot:Gregarina_sp_Poly_1__4263@NODE_2321_length_2298_cov_338_532048_g1486_i0_p1_GENE_NODE_2321_length_2298_cov_338_532048_g1486_i0NODE_2321_length_2298_cov_338_532048_g1486_i0_p1_ORF_typecomplete_len219_score24_74_NODE_2321_length_2298_cov_338_532048_g1486_i0105761